MNYRLRSIASVSAVLAVVMPVLFTHTAIAQSTLTTSASSVSIQRKEFRLKITNNKKLITVEDKDGSFLFAQVITTPNLKVDLSKPAKSGFIKLILRDAHDKALWQTRLGDGGQGSLQFNFTEKNDVPAGISVGVTPYEPSSDKSHSQVAMKGTAVLGEDNILSSADFRGDDGDGAHMERQGNKIVVTTQRDGKPDDTTTMSLDMDAKAIHATQNGQEAFAVKLASGSANFKDAAGTFTFRTIKKDSKEYIDLDLGDRHIFIEGTNFKATSDGKDITVTPVGPSSP